MIKVTERKKMKKVFKLGYFEGIQTLLKDKGVVDKKGKEYSIAFISHVFNGRNNNLEIESAFFELYQKMRDEQSKKSIERRQILENKKPEAGTSGL